MGSNLGGQLDCFPRKGPFPNAIAYGTHKSRTSDLRLTISMSLLSPLTFLIFGGLFYVAKAVFGVPAHLRHLPRVPVLPLLWSYLSGEVEDTRIRRLILPFLIDKNEPLVLVWVLGRWMVHILDIKALLSCHRSYNPSH